MTRVLLYALIYRTLADPLRGFRAEVEGVRRSLERQANR